MVNGIVNFRLSPITIQHHSHSSVAVLVQTFARLEGKHINICQLIYHRHSSSSVSGADWDWVGNGNK
jgi:hypothetical protein